MTGSRQIAHWRKPLGSLPVPPVTASPPKPVLFLDDEPTYVDMMVQLLSAYLTCPIHAFTRPEDALAALPQLQPAMVVTDYSMPTMTGIEFLKQVHAVMPDISAIMITGHQIELEGVDLDQVPGLRATLFKPLRWRTIALHIIAHWPDSNPPALRDAPAGP
jgi:CheY-like chemotaxis protein